MVRSSPETQGEGRSLGWVRGRRRQTRGTRTGVRGARAKWHWAIDRLRATVRVVAAEHFALHADSRSTTSRRFPRARLSERKKKSADGSSGDGGGGGGGEEGKARRVVTKRG